MTCQAVPALHNEHICKRPGKDNFCNRITESMDFGREYRSAWSATMAYRLEANEKSSYVWEKEDIL
jgi:hypothetical protein